MLITDPSQWIWNFIAENNDTSRMSRKQINEKIQLRQQLNIFSREFLSGVDCQFGLFPYSLLYPHSFVADLPVGHSEDVQIICYNEVSIKLCFEHEVL